MKNKFKRSLALLLSFSMIGLSSCGKEVKSKDSSDSIKTLTVLNAGKYIDESVISSFEKKYNCRIKYEEYQSPEEMYTKYKSGSIKYDVINTSDYMIEKLISEGELMKLDKSKLPHLDNMDPSILKLAESFDPGNLYSVPYFYGTVGILYNKKEVDKEAVKSWSILWDKKYKNEIIQEDSVRDAFIPALELLGYDLNTKDHNKLNQALSLLKEQYPLTYAYMVDQTADEMISGNAKLAVVYSGEAATAMDSNHDLSYSLPEEGSNVWIDSWFIPKTCTDTDLAHAFIDYMNTPKIAMKNFEYVWYSSPVLSVQKKMSEDEKKNPALVFDQDLLQKCETFHALSDKDSAYMSKLWQELKARL